MRILITGGAGYLGTHTCLSLIAAGHHVHVFDSLVNASREAVRRTSEIAGYNIPVTEGDLLDRSALAAAIAECRPEAVVHFAGLKSVSESNSQPLRYVTNNVTGTVQLLEVMDTFGVRTLLFSSSATVYGVTDTVPTREDHTLSVTNPYGRTKLAVEEILRDLSASAPGWRIGILRYFNPVGAHPTGRIGEDPRGVPNNLVPFVGQVAVGRRDTLHVFGGDYPTPDGTGVRDYLHVMDLADGHVAALAWVAAKPGVGVWNLGTGRGYSVLEVIRAYEEVSGRPVPYTIMDRRPGDVAVSYADATKAAKELGWKASRTLHDMIEDHWHWQSANPTGYGK
ncbi:UDP-glucose 4-epimerase [Sinomonas cyclohexanicum]|uniref:UDP-glucose 4-epimerase n=1 Tax=Sinomonas cyclohexanicum TaxID=322009 RepID=A0ABM7PY56_SINCY|nr:UDP-glucose 4-epimerase GalE [Corynebacterium cyclohexanicum]BCT77072.1 UDP-glucose 4-epimerase [Corynebacterium cyclohexanicum]